MILRELIVSLGLDWKDLKKGLENADTAMEKFKGAAGKIAVALAAGGAAFGLWKIVEGATAAGDEVAKLAQRFGVNAEELQRLSFAADMSGASTEQLRTGLEYLSRTANEASTGSKEASQKFAELGIQVTTAGGKLKSADELFYEVSEAVSKVPNPTKQAAMALELMGRGSGALLPLMKGGAKEARKLGLELDDLGGVMDSAFLKRSEEFQDDLTRMERAFGGVQRRIAQAVLPVFEWLIQNTTRLVSSFGRLLDGTEYLRVGLIMLAGVAAIAGVIMLAPWIKLILIVSAIVLGFAVLAAVVEDVYMWLTGGESAIGRLLGPAETLLDRFMSYEAANPILNGLLKTFQFFYYLLGKVSQLIYAIAKALFGDFEPLKTLWKDYTDAMTLWAETVKKIFHNVLVWIGNKMFAARDLIMNGIKGLPGGEYVLRAVGALTGAGSEGVGPAAPGASASVSAGAARTSVVNAPSFKFDLNVTGAPGMDENALAVQVAKQVDERIQAHAQEAYSGLVPAVAGVR